MALCQNRESSKASTREVAVSQATMNRVSADGMVMRSGGLLGCPNGPGRSRLQVLEHSIAV